MIRMLALSASLAVVLGVLPADAALAGVPIGRDIQIGGECARPGELNHLCPEYALIDDWPQLRSYHSPDKAKSSPSKKDAVRKAFEEAQRALEAAQKRLRGGVVEELR